MFEMNIVTPLGSATRMVACLHRATVVRHPVEHGVVTGLVLPKEAQATADGRADDRLVAETLLFVSLSLLMRPLLFLALFSPGPHWIARTWTGVVQPVAPAHR